MWKKGDMTAGNKEMAVSGPVVLRLRGEYQNPAGYSAADTEHFSTSLPRFLFEGVSEISQYKSYVEKKTVLFAAEFHLRAGWGEEFLFNLNCWPLGVRRLAFG